MRCVQTREYLTNSCDYNHVAVLPFSHCGQYGFDDVYIGEKVDLEDFIYKADGSAALRQFLDSPDNG